MHEPTEMDALGAMIETIELRSTSPRVFLDGQERSAIEAIRQRARQPRIAEPPPTGRRFHALGLVLSGVALISLAAVLM